MLALALTFPGGRYHATPWGRHVNEAAVEWPPSPWRISRAFIATWHRKLDPSGRDRAGLQALLAALAAEPPLYRVPTAVHSHTRHYMPTRSGKADKSTLIFDAFARLAGDAALILLWPNLELAAEQTALFDTLADGVGFLGRAESWAEIQRLESWEGEPNCVPADTAGNDPAGGRITLLAPMPAADYEHFRAAQLEGLGKRADLRPRERKAIAATLPESWLDAIAVESGDLRAAGWNIPPASREIPYWIHGEPLRSGGRLPPQSVAQASATTFRFALYGKPLPRVEDTVRMGEWLRKAAMSQAKGLFGEGAVPSLISGHGLPDGNRHDHAFWLCEDTDGDGRIDHLIVHVPAALAGQARRALENIRKIWIPDGQEWNLLFEGAGEPADFRGPDGSAICGQSRHFASRTPYLMPWHTKRNFGLEDQVRRECDIRRLDQIDAVETLPYVRVGTRRRTPIDFHRFRSRRGLTQPDTRGAFLRITFAKPVDGPLALGFGCHFGLGLFEPVVESKAPIILASGGSGRTAG